MASFSEGFNSSMKTKMAMDEQRAVQAMRARAQVLSEQEADLKRRLETLKDAKEFASGLREPDKKIAEAKIREFLRRKGEDPDDPITKERVKTLVNSTPGARERMARGVLGVAAGDPQADAAIKGFATGDLTFEQAEKQVATVKAQRARKRLAQGEPSVQPSAQMPVETGRITAPAMGVPATPPMAAPGPVSGAVPPPAQLGTPEKPQPRINVAAMGASGGQPRMSDMADPFSVDSLANKPMTMGGVFGTKPQGAGEDRLLQNIAQRESGGRADAQAPTSSATGLFQYTGSTWIDRIKKYKPEWSQGLGRDELLQLRTNPEYQTEIMRQDVASNSAILERGGFEASPANLYAMHHFGVVGGGELLRADPDTPVTDIMPSGVIKANPYLKNHTAGSLLSSFGKLATGVDSTSTAPAEPAPRAVKTETISPQTIGQPAASSQAAATAQATPLKSDYWKGRLEEAIASGDVGKDLISPFQKNYEDALKAEQTTSAAAATSAKQVKGLGEVVAGARDLPIEFGKEATERAIGPWQASDPAAMEPGVGGAVANVVSKVASFIPRMWAEAQAIDWGGAKPTEVRDRIEAQGGRISAMMKPLIRQAGEGAWSDKDQQFLDRLTNGLSRSRDLDEYQRRIEDITKFIEDTTGQKLQLPEPPTGPSANAPPSAEAQEGLMESLGRVTTDKYLIEQIQSMLGF